MEGHTVPWKKNISEKPDWFDVKKYDGAKNFTAREWACSLLIRLDALVNVRSESRDDKEDDYGVQKYIKEGNQEYFSSIKDDPLMLSDISEIIRQPLPWKHNNEHLNKLREKGLSYSHISSLNVLSAGCLYQDIERIKLFENITQGHMNELDVSRHSNRLQLSYDEEVRKNPDSEISVQDKHLVHPDQLHLVVSLSTTNDVLMKQFEQWLSSAREKFGYSQEKTITIIKLQKLYNNKVLPYLDLKIWSEMCNVDISGSTYYEWLMPEFYNSNSEHANLDDWTAQTEKLADKVLSHTYIYALHNFGDIKGTN